MCLKKKPKKVKRDRFLDEVQARRWVEILSDSIELMKTTKYPKTFFGRYKDALLSANEILKLTHLKSVRRDIRVILDDLTNNRDEIFNDFIDRCYFLGNLYSFKDDLLSGKYNLSSVNIAYINRLLEKIETDDENQPESGEYIYCSLSFGTEDKTYYYKTADETLKCGDYVIVPVGNNGREEIARIEKIERFPVENTPYPPRITKNIIGKYI